MTTPGLSLNPNPTPNRHRPTLAARAEAERAAAMKAARASRVTPTATSRMNARPTSTPRSSGATTTSSRAKSTSATYRPKAEATDTRPRPAVSESNPKPSTPRPEVATETNSNPKSKKSRELKSAAKKNLKVMRRTRNQHPVRTQARILKYGTSGFARNIWLSTAATSVMIVTLVILFVTTVASAILTNTAQIMRDKIDSTIYIRPNTPEATYRQLADIMKKDENVKSLETSTSEQEYNKFAAEKSNASGLSNILDSEMKEIMIAQMPGTMRIKVYNSEDFSSIKDIVENDPLFQEYVDPAESPPTKSTRSKSPPLPPGRASPATLALG